MWTNIGSNRPKKWSHQVKLGEPVCLLGYLQEHGWLKASCITKKPIPAWMTSHKNYIIGDPCTNYRQIYPTVSVPPELVYCLYNLGGGDFVSPESFMNFWTLVNFPSPSRRECFNLEETDTQQPYTTQDPCGNWLIHLPLPIIKLCSLGTLWWIYVRTP